MLAQAPPSLPMGEGFTAPAPPPPPSPARPAPRPRPAFTLRDVEVEGDRHSFRRAPGLAGGGVQHPVDRRAWPGPRSPPGRNAAPPGRRPGTRPGWIRRYSRTALPIRAGLWSAWATTTSRNGVMKAPMPSETRPMNCSARIRPNIVAIGRRQGAQADPLQAQRVGLGPGRRWSRTATGPGAAAWALRRTSTFSAAARSCTTRGQEKGLALARGDVGDGGLEGGRQLAGGGVDQELQDLGLGARRSRSPRPACAGSPRRRPRAGSGYAARGPPRWRWRRARRRAAGPVRPPAPPGASMARTT